MQERQYWWVYCHGEVQPALVTFGLDHPDSVWLLGMEARLPAATVEMIQPLPDPPARHS